MADKFEDTALGAIVKAKKLVKAKNLMNPSIHDLVDSSLPSRESILYGRSIVRYKDSKREEFPVDSLPQASPKIINE